MILIFLAMMPAALLYHDFDPDLKNVFVSLQEKFKCAVGAQVVVKHLQDTIVNNVEINEMHKR